MKVYRLAREKYANELSGIGAAKYGNRWNSKGVEIIYSAESRALAMAEVLVHLSLDTLPSDFQMIQIEIPDSIHIESLSIKQLQKEWNSFPSSIQTQKIGDTFIQDNKMLVLKVPSAVVKGDHNYLINPNHLDFYKVEITNISKFPFDHRIFK